tara:strand:+ start:173 stop:376 length:204 start_codon:yes stop_codon:yes gene_type:complete
LLVAVDRDLVQILIQAAQAQALVAQAVLGHLAQRHSIQEHLTLYELAVVVPEERLEAAQVRRAARQL